MNTGICSSGQPYTGPSFLFRKGSCFSLFVTGIIIFLWSMMPAQAQAREARDASPFANHLAKPPVFNPDTTEESAQPDCAVPGNRHAHPMTCATGKTAVTNRVSVKNEHQARMDITHLPAPAAGGRKVSQAIAASKKDEMMENEWKMGFELRGSPVKEAHGDPDRHDSLGALIKGNMKF